MKAEAVRHGSVLSEDSTAGVEGGRGPGNEGHWYDDSRILLGARCREESDKTLRAQRVWRSDGLNRGAVFPARAIGLPGCEF